MKIGDERAQIIGIGSVVSIVVVPTVFGIVQDEIPKHPEIAVAVVAGIVGGTLLLNRLLSHRLRARRPRVGAEEFPDDTPVRLATRQLALAVRDQWWPEARLRGLVDGATLIHVGWSLAPVPEGLGADAAAKLNAWDLPARSVDRLAEFFQQIPTRSLVILGPAESGKSAAAILLTLDLLKARGEDSISPVPVLFGLASWDPTTNLGPWLARRLVEDHPWLRAESKYGEAAAERLLREGRILPILDALDEVPDARDEQVAAQDQVPARHRAKVITALATTTLDLPGWVLTSRGTDYREAEQAGTEWLHGAVEISLSATSPAQASSYLRNVEAPARLPRWDPVLAELARNATGPLAQALSSPLMVFLAHEVYRGASGRPAELLEMGKREQIEAHLVEGFVPAVFPDIVEPGRPGGRWRRDDARRWLTYLAVELERRGHHEVRWWELSAYARPATAVVTGLVAGVTALLAVGLSIGVLFSPLAGAVIGGVIALALGVASAVNKPPKPSEIQIRETGRLQSAITSGLPIALIVIAAGTLIRDLTFGLVVGVVFGLPIGILYGMTTPDATARAVDPRFLLRRDLYVGLIYGTAYGIPAVGVGGLVSGNPVTGVVLGIVCALAGGLLYGPIWMLALKGSKVGVVAFGHLAIATAWFAPRRTLPWRVLRFLADAHQLGVLRQAGGIYQFRHLRLQKALAEMGGFVQPGVTVPAVHPGKPPQIDPVALPAHPPPDVATGP